MTDETSDTTEETPRNDEGDTPVEAPYRPRGPRDHRGMRLTTLKNGRDQLARVARRMELGTMDVVLGKALVYALKEWVSVHREVQAETRWLRLQESLEAAQVLLETRTRELEDARRQLSALRNRTDA